MYLRIAAIAAAGLVAMTACDSLPQGSEDDDWWDTADTGNHFDDVTQQISQIDMSCNVGSQDMWNYFVETDGWAGSMRLEIFETGDGNWPSNPSAVWDESHDMDQLDYDEGGAWDQWDLQLRHVSTIGQQQSGVSTLFGCEWNDGGSLAFMATMYDDSGRELDCAIWGHESSQYFESYLGNDCICFENDGNCTN